MHMGLFLSLTIINKIQWIALYVGSLVCVQAYLKDKVSEKELPDQRVNAIKFLINITKCILLDHFVFLYTMPVFP